VAIRSEYRYSAEISAFEGRPIQTVELADPDWAPALDWAYFQHVRAGARSPLMRCADGTIEPVWDDAAGRPFVSAIRVAPGTRRRAGPACEIPSRYLRSEVEIATAPLVTAGSLKAGDPFHYRILASPRTTARVVGQRDGGIAVENIAQALPVQSGSLAASLAHSAELDSEFTDAVDMRVVIAAEVLEAAVALAASMRDLETGGVLVGTLRRDESTCELFLDVHALLPARHAISQPDRVTFTPDTWAEARTAIALRGRDECLVGWMHSHPWFCAKCPPEAQRRCVLSRPFLSDQDRSLHRTVFARPFDVALLVTDHGGAGHSLAVFGWRRGIIERRGYHVSGRAPQGIAAAGFAAESNDLARVRPPKSTTQRSCGES
jgi:hypothetical protein